MKKILIGVALFAIVGLALGAAGFVYAQSQTPPEPFYSHGFGYGHGRGMMGAFGDYGHSMWGDGDDGCWMGGDDHDGPVHEAVVSALADALGLSVEEIEERHDAGESMWEIAEAQGLSSEEAYQLMLSVHEAAMEEAVAEGWLTEEQAEWMQEHQEHMREMWDRDGEFEGYGPRGGHCGGGRFYQNDAPTGNSW